MRHAVLLVVDIALILLATLIALLLRNDFEVARDTALHLEAYFFITGGLAILVYTVANLHNAIWRFSGLADYLRVAGATATLSLSATALTYAYNGMDGVARSIPVLQGLVGTALLIGVRVAHRLHHASRQDLRTASGLLRAATEAPSQTVLIVGVTRLAEAYLRAIADIAEGCVQVAGFAAHNGRQTGRLVSSYPVLGTSAEIEEILDELEVHGVSVDCIVVACQFTSLSPESRAAIDRAVRSRELSVRLLATELRFGRDGVTDSVRKFDETSSMCREPQLELEVRPVELDRISQRTYWKVKRAADFILALCLLLICFPLMVIESLLVIATMGFPVGFWQQRPGYGGKPFRLYKFRTMRAVQATDGRRLSEDERLSVAGNILRRLRLDELPQLYNILIGQMSFIGPRPLLPKDQPDCFHARLLIRPGLTGWAQVVGGRNITPRDKAALDIWYVRHASVILDLEIAARTIPVVLFGERIAFNLIDRAWNELNESRALNIG